MSQPVDGTFKTADGCAIAYTLHPAPGKPRLALVHSLALDRSFWNWLIPELDGSAEILTFDCRGHGASGKMPGPYTPQLFARDLAELMDHLGRQRATVAGCSMGGCVAQAFGAVYPQKTEALGLIDTTAWYGAEAPKQWRERAATARNKGLGALTEFQATRWFGDAFRKEHPDILAALNRIFLANDIDCYQATCEMLGDADLRPLLGSLKMPVAIAVGEEDYAATVAMSEQIHAAVSHSTLNVLKGARHLAPVERPREISVLLTRLLASRAGAQS